MGIVEYSLILILIIYFSVQGEHKQKITLFAGMGILFVLAALRHEVVGTDIASYINTFERQSEYTFEKLITVIPFNEIKDSLYHYTAWFFSKIFVYPQLWLTGIALLYSFAVGRLMYKESNQMAISFLVFFALEFYYFSLTGLRQTIAMAITTLSYPFIKNRKLIPFILCVLLASLYHKSALIFLLIYPIANMRLGIFHVIVAIIAFVIFYLYQEQLLQFLTNILLEERYDYYLGNKSKILTMTGFFIQTACFVCCLYYYKDITKQNENALLFYNAIYIGWLLQLFSSFIAEFFRISMYFSTFNIVLVANAAVCEKEGKSNTIMQLLIMGVFLWYVLYAETIPYKFFWQ